MSDDTAPDENWGRQLDRLPPTTDNRVVEGWSSHEEVADWRGEWFDVDPAIFDGYVFWERGAGKVWTFRDEVVDPIGVEGLGMHVPRTRQRHRKPSANAVQRFYGDTAKNVIELSPGETQASVDGRDRQLSRRKGDWGYLAAAHEIVGKFEPLGAGLYLHGELRSTAPKGRQEDLAKPE